MLYKGFSGWGTLHKEGCPIFTWILISKSDARYSCGQQLSLCRSPRMSFLPPVRRRCLAYSRKRGRCKIISHSDGHSVVESAKQKADTQRHQKSVRALLSLQNDVLCIGFEFQRRDCLFIRSLADNTKKHRVRMTVFSYSYRGR